MQCLTSPRRYLLGHGIGVEVASSRDSNDESKYNYGGLRAVCYLTMLGSSSFGRHCSYLAAVQDRTIAGGSLSCRSFSVLFSVYFRHFLNMTQQIYTDDDAESPAPRVAIFVLLLDLDVISYKAATETPQFQ